MVTSWLLVLYTGVHAGTVPTFVPNLASSQECLRVAQSINQTKPGTESKFKCIEVYNADPRQGSTLK